MGNGYLFFGGQTHLIHDTLVLSGVVVVGPLKFSKIPHSDHSVHLKVLQPPLVTLEKWLIVLATAGDLGELNYHPKLPVTSLLLRIAPAAAHRFLPPNL